MCFFFLKRCSALGSARPRLAIFEPKHVLGARSFATFFHVKCAYSRTTYDGSLRKAMTRFFVCAARYNRTPILLSWPLWGRQRVDVAPLHRLLTFANKKKWEVNCVDVRAFGFLRARRPSARLKLHTHDKLLVSVLFVLQMMVAMKRVKWDGTTTGSSLTASIAKVHDELKVPRPVGRLATAYAGGG